MGAGTMGPTNFNASAAMPMPMSTRPIVAVSQICFLFPEISLAKKDWLMMAVQC
jgi:hypothetical protein